MRACVCVCVCVHVHDNVCAGMYVCVYACMNKAAGAVTDPQHKSHEHGAARLSTLNRELLLQQHVLCVH